MYRAKLSTFTVCLDKGLYIFLSLNYNSNPIKLDLDFLSHHNVHLPQLMTYIYFLNMQPLIIICVALYLFVHDFCQYCSFVIVVIYVCLFFISFIYPGELQFGPWPVFVAPQLLSDAFRIQLFFLHTLVVTRIHTTFLNNIHVDMKVHIMLTIAVNIDTWYTYIHKHIHTVRNYKHISSQLYA